MKIVEQGEADTELGIIQEATETSPVGSPQCLKVRAALSRSSCHLWKKSQAALWKGGDTRDSFMEPRTA